MPDNISKIGSSDKDSTTTTAAPSTGSAAKPHPPAPEYIRQSRSHLWIWIVVILVLGIGGLIYYRKQQAAEAAAKTKAAMANRSVPITTATVTTGPIGVYINALGTVTSVYTATITTRVDGQIVSVNYTEGQMVHKGEVLVQIDPRPYQAALTQAEGTLAHDEALLAEARIDLDRYQLAFNRNAIAKQQLDDQTQTVKQYEGSVKNDQGTVASAATNLDYATIKAPIDGRVGLRLVDPGNIVTAASSTPLVVITQLQPITVIFSVAEDYLPQIQKQLRQSHKMSVDAFDRNQQTKLASGTLLTLDNQIDTTTGTVKLKAIFANTDISLFPNQFVNARLLVDTQQNATLVPTAAIQRNAQGAFVYLVKSDQTAAMQTVTIGTTDGSVAAVQGVNPGDAIAITGFDKLQDGAKVSIQKAPADNNGPAKRLLQQRNPQERGKRWFQCASARRRRKSSVNPSRPFIIRPVATSLLMAAILLAGFVGFTQLPVSALPEVDYPTIQVVTFYPGANPDVVASAVTAPLERQFGQVPGLSQMTSTSSDGSSVIVLQFSLELNIDVAEQEVQAAINAAQTYLPADLTHAADLQQDQSRRHADPDAGAHVQDDSALASGRPRGHAPGAKNRAAARCGTGEHQRRPKARGARAGESHRAFFLRDQPGRRPHRAAIHQLELRAWEISTGRIRIIKSTPTINC